MASPTDTAKKEGSKANSPTQSAKAPLSPTVTKPEGEASNSKTQEGPTDASLPPPPRPSVIGGSDYFQGAALASHLQFEPNPFEHSFAGGGAETPGGTKLPSVAALTSPASLIPGTGTTPFPWGSGSLRTGPLSPAMLSGPTTDYFGETHHLRGGFTPNESSLRTGLTPGGGGSMFPAPSPNSQALFSTIAAATPGSMDFHRAAMSAAATNRRKNENAPPNVTSNPQDMANGSDIKPPTAPMASANEQFVTHETTDAANGLFMLAQARTGPSDPSQYRGPPQQPAHGHGHPQQQLPNGNATNGAVRHMSETMESDESENNRPNTRNKGKKPAANGRRKAEDQPAKAPAAKKGKGNNGNSQFMDPEPPSEEESEPMNDKDQFNANGKKMTDEEKRKNFLERNRVAALKCRQRKKQWLQNLQTKVEMYTTENDNLSNQISALREEIVALKTMLLAHKDCPVTQQQQQMGYMPQEMAAQFGVHPQAMGHPPYQMGMQPPNQQVMAGQGGSMNRRFSTIAPAPNGFTYPGDYQPRLSEGVRPSIEGPDPMTDHASHTNGNGASGEQYNTMAPEFMHVESPKRFDEGPEE